MAEREGKPWVYGSAVVNGVVRFLSPSSIERADASGNGGGCARKWFYRYVMKWKEEERDWQSLGKKCHGEIEHYLTTGEEVLGRIALAAKPYIPAPDVARKRLLIEFDIGMGDLNLVSLRAAGVPIIGYTDVIHAEPAIHETGEGFYQDPPHTIEALDWKFGSAKKGAVADEKGRGACFAKSGIELASDTQMVVYGEWAARVAKNPVDHVRLSHVYTNTKGRPESSKASTLVTREHLAARWEYTEAVVRTIVDVARERDPERVPANTNACDAFGGCAYREQCSAARFNSLDDFFGTTGSAGLLDALQRSSETPGVQPPSLQGANGFASFGTFPNVGSQPLASRETGHDESPHRVGSMALPTMQKEEHLALSLPSSVASAVGSVRDMPLGLRDEHGWMHRPLSSEWEFSVPVVSSLQSRVGPLEGGSSYPRALDPLSTGVPKMGLIEGLNLGALGVPSTAVPVTASPAGITASLGLGVDIAAQMAAIAAPAFTPLPPTREFAQAVGEINAKGYGFPPLEGRAAQMFGVLNAKPGITAEYKLPGFGRLGQVAAVEDPARIAGIAAELAAVPVNPTPDRPIAPVMGLVSPETPASKPELAATPVEGFAFPGMNAHTHNMAVTPGVAVPGLIASVPPAIAAPILASGAPAQVPAAALPEAPAAKTRKPRGPNKPKPGTIAPVAGEIVSSEPLETAGQDGAWLFVNAVPNVAFTDLQPYINEWTVGMARHYKCDPMDIRCTPKDHPLSYGAWKGALTAVARKACTSLPAGAYYLDLRASEFNEACFEGFRSARVPNADGTDGEPVFELIVRGHDR